MVIETSDYLHRIEANQFNLFTQKLHNGISKTISSFEGEIIEHNDNKYVVGFNNASDAVFAALKIKANFKYITPKFDSAIRQLKIGIAYDEEHNKAVLLATRICEVVKNPIVITQAVKREYERTNRNSFINRDDFKIMSASEELFISRLMDYLEEQWNDLELSIEQLTDPLKYSKSQIYRKLLKLTGKSPSTFIRDYRLNRALKRIHLNAGSIGEIALASGIKNPAYFSKCFKKRFGILPSKYMQQHVH